MDINLSNKPNETTPRLVKQVFLAACAQYVVGAIFLLSGFKVGLLLLLTGGVTQFLVKRFLHWYLTG